MLFVAVPISVIAGMFSPLDAQSSAATRRIAIEPVTRLVDKEGLLSGGPVHVSRAPDGSAYVVLERSEAVEALYVFGANGTFRARVGRRGSGPGEFDRPWFSLFSRDGSLHVLDVGLNRRTVIALSGEPKVIRMAPMEARCADFSAAAMLPDERIVMACGLADPKSAGYALHEVDRNNKIVTTFEPVNFDVRRRFLLQRVLHVRSDGSVLSGDVHNMAIVEHAPNRTTSTRVQLRAAWAAPIDADEAPSDGSFERRPTPRLAAVWEDSHAIWVAAHVPSPQWKPGPSLRELLQAGRKPQEGQARVRYDCVIEALDRRTFATIASQRMRGTGCGNAIGNGYFVRTSSEADVVTLDVVHVRLTAH